VLQHLDSHVRSDSEPSHKSQSPGGLWHGFDCVHYRVRNSGASEAPEEHFGASVFRVGHDVQERNEQEGWDILQIIQMSP
jgi:hypothetical protein